MRWVCVVAVWGWTAAGAGAADLSVEAFGGGQIVETTSGGASHGRLREEVTLGRTVLGGLLVDLGLGQNHHFTLEVGAGPYHNDTERYCISSYNYVAQRFECAMIPDYETRFALLFGGQYLFVAARQRIRPLAGLGIGAKRYTYRAGDSGRARDPANALAVQAILGVEFASRVPLRFEARPTLIPHSPFLLDAAYYGNSRAQFELQLRLSVRLPVGRR